MTDPPSILIVESDVRIRHPLAEYLRQCGYQVLEVADAATARDMLDAPEFRIDIVLADLDAPHNEGFALAQWIRRHHPETEVVLAGSVEMAVHKASHLCEEGPALRKPYNHQHVLNEIRRLRRFR
jgi:DNA-binding response OmpR family regulator